MDTAEHATTYILCTRYALQSYTTDSAQPSPSLPSPKLHHTNYATLHTTLHHTALHTTLHTLHCTTLHTLHCCTTTLHYATLYYNTLHDTVHTLPKENVYHKQTCLGYRRTVLSLLPVLCKSTRFDASKVPIAIDDRSVC